MLGFVANECPERKVDHINGNPLDNRRCNLRVCTNQENIRNSGLFSSNTSGYRGVGFFKPHGLWRATIKVDGVVRHLGYFRTAPEASVVREAAARRLYGEFYREI
jgi:hypothetical protein